jgi:hypothetical protein
VDENRRVATLSVAPLTLDEWTEVQFSDDEKTLFLTSRTYRNRISMKVWTFDLSGLPGGKE